MAKSKKLNEKHLENVLPEEINNEKRKFFKKILIGTAFVTPFFSSTSMKNFKLGVPKAYAS